MSVITNIEDLRKLAKKRVPKMFYDYVDCGSWDQITYSANEDDFKKIKLRQKVAVDVSSRSTRASLLDVECAMPVALAPTGLAGMQRANGEILAARAAEQFGIPFTLSTFSICSIEDVAEKTSKPFWFQLYVMKDKKYSKRLIERAKKAGCSALVLTLDLHVMGQRHLDIKNGLSVPPKLTSLSNLLSMAIKPNWCFEMLYTGRRSFGNVVGHVDGVSNLSSLSAWVSEAFDQSFTWDDIEQIKEWWGGKLILKGILDENDASMAVKSGADAVIVSNHGGRQLDGTCSTISMLPKIKKLLADDIEIFVDGGIRSGQDVLKSCAFGADGTFVGRPFLYGLGALGEQGVIKSLEIIQKELDLSMALCGVRSINEIGYHIIL